MVPDSNREHLAQCEKLKRRRIMLTLLLVLATGLALAQPAPQFWIRNLEGQRFDSRKVGDEPIVVSFFFVHCVPCLKEIPELHAFISEELPEVHLLFIDPIKEDSKQDMIGFAERLGVPQKFFYKDGLGIVSRKFFRGVQQAFPTIVGLKGRQELFRLSGLPEGALAEVQKRL
jgi:thiol-disulfide isomerase/thioredoxin